MQILDVNADIRLRYLSTEDAEIIFETIDRQRTYLGRWLPFVENTKKVDDTMLFIKSVIESPNKSLEPAYIIQFQDKFCGIIALKGSDPLNLKTEIGYWLSQDYQHRGIMTMAVRRMVSYIFKDMKFNRVQIKCAIGNDPSTGIPKRLNFKFEGIERQGEQLSRGVFTDLEVYSCIAGEWGKKND